MTETVDIRDDDAVARLVLSAVAKYVKEPEFAERFANKGSTVQVEMAVNGVSVSAPKTLAEAWRRMDAMLEERARRMAVRMVTEAGLEPLAQALRDAENNIREKLGIWE